jgi:hypothetical protein
MAGSVVRRPSLLTDAQLRQLAGLSASQFGRLVAAIGPVWEAERETRLTAEREGVPRRRAFGAGRHHELPLAGRLLLVLMYLRWNVPYRMLAVVFGTNKDTINRAVAQMTRLLAEHGITAPDGTRVGDEAGLQAQLAKLSGEQRAALVDGTFVPIPRPGKGGWDAQKLQYSPHKWASRVTAETN